MAELLSQSREASARIRVENIIHTDITVELMEILELYTELLLARAGLLDVRDKNVKEGIGGAAVGDDSTGLEEAAASIIYAAPRLARDVRELAIVRNMLIDRFGKEFSIRANDNVDNCVPARVVDKLRVDPPGEKLVQAYLEEIARTYGVDWPRHREEVDELGKEVDDEQNEDDDDGVGGGSKEAPILADGTPSTPAKKPNKIDIGSLQNATPPAGLGAKSPVSVAPPGARTDNPSPKVKLPGGGVVGKNDGKAKSVGTAAATTAKGKGAAAAGGAGGAVPGKVPTVDDLAKRFAALK
jgi:vacuolar protein sorting-associated protein IST1